MSPLSGRLSSGHHHSARPRLGPRPLSEWMPIRQPAPPFDPENAPPTCLSSQEHGPEVIQDHIRHYFGCLTIAERADYLNPENEVWKYEVGLDEQYLRSLPEYSNLTDEKITEQAKIDINKKITEEARARINKKIESTAVAIEAQYRRTHILREALRKSPDPTPSTTTNTFSRPSTSQDATAQTGSNATPTSTGHLVRMVEESAQAWKASAQYKEGIQVVQNWKNNPTIPALGSATTALAESATLVMVPVLSPTFHAAGSQSPGPTQTSNGTSEFDLEREKIREVVTRARKKPPPLDSQLADYWLERDVNGYLIQYTRKSTSNSHRPSGMGTLPSRKPDLGIVPSSSQTAETSQGSSPTASAATIVRAATTGTMEVTALSQSPTTTAFPHNFHSARSNPFTPTLTTNVEYLEPIDEDLADAPFKGRFPDQRMAINLLLGIKNKSSEAANEQEGFKENILSKARCKTIDDPRRVRYFHIPANNMDWVEKAIARYYDEEHQDLGHSYRDSPVRTHTQMLLRPQFWRGQQHGARSGVVHARHMRPLCERVSSEVNEIEDNPKNIVLFMPYLHWDTDRMRNKISKMIDAESEQHRKRNEANNLKKRNDRKEERAKLQKATSTPIRHDSNDPFAQSHRDLFRKKGSLEPAQTVGDLVERLVSYGRDGQRIKIDNNGRLQVKSKLGQYLIDAARLYEGMSTYRDQKMIEEYLYKDPPLHPRRTLDQSYYWTLRTTKARDRDQVVYRGTNMSLDFCHKLEAQKPEEKGILENLWDKAKTVVNGGPSEKSEVLKWSGHWKKTDDNGCDHCRNDIRKISQLIMVDQLWMWVLDERTIITSFPKRYGFNKQDLSGVHKSIRMRLKSARKNQIRSVYDLALIILDECSNTFFDRTKTEDSQPQVMDIFSESIGNVTNQHTISFQHVWHWTQKASDIYRSKSKYVSSSELHVPLLDIHPEGKLQREIKDIIDELDIMIHVHKKQREVIRRFCKHVEHILDPEGRWKEGAVDYHSKPLSSPSDNPQKIAEREEKRDQLAWFRMQSQELLSEVDDRLDELEGLKKGAESTAKSVNDLLSLKQQQASVVQAWESVKQAEEAVLQGRSIMMFTVITIVFLPLSFISSMFGMNNHELGGSDNSMSIYDQIKWILMASFLVVFVAVVIAFSNLLRTVIWSVYTLFTTAVMVYLPAWKLVSVYGIWLSISEKWNHTEILKATEAKVQRMKDDVRMAKKKRRNRNNWRKWKAKREKEKQEEQELKKKEEQEKRGGSAGTNGADTQGSQIPQAAGAVPATPGGANGGTPGQQAPTAVTASNTTLSGSGGSGGGSSNGNGSGGAAGTATTSGGRSSNRRRFRPWRNAPSGTQDHLLPPPVVSSSRRNSGSGSGSQARSAGEN
ncbi:hypothetical protein QBC35DRAFT_554014 [Podospora australis]|uniref:Ankyrin repeat protein n=1 Tax=Podospora australis TaxID=1536484 RepID=A0AAN7AH82_9PEZI|nr:hypothetical protein QBC35DRAFT_554014 [Podospora australis]